jgi:tetratricopeptide (TPR) repeat protein
LIASRRRQGASFVKRKAAAFVAFESALSISPSCAITHILGGMMSGWAGHARRAIEWGSRDLQLSPFDAWAFAARHSMVLGQFKLGRFDAAAEAATRAIQANPAHSISFMLQTATLAGLGKIVDARNAAATVMALQPNFRYGQQLAGVDCEPDLAAALSAALNVAGLALGAGAGSELRAPVGVALVGGLLVSQVLTLFTTPLIYLYLDRLSQRLSARFATIPFDANTPR